MLLCGSAKKDITYFKPGVGMMGFGMWFNIVKEVETPLFARAYVFIDQESGKKVAYVNAEICFITVARAAMSVGCWWGCKYRSKR